MYLLNAELDTPFKQFLFSGRTSRVKVCTNQWHETVIKESRLSLFKARFVTIRRSDHFRIYSSLGCFPENGTWNRTETSGKHSRRGYIGRKNTIIRKSMKVSTNSCTSYFNKHTFFKCTENTVGPTFGPIGEQYENIVGPRSHCRHGARLYSIYDRYHDTAYRYPLLPATAENLYKYNNVGKNKVFRRSQRNVKESRGTLNSTNFYLFSLRVRLSN